MSHLEGSSSPVVGAASRGAGRRAVLGRRDAGVLRLPMLVAGALAAVWMAVLLAGAPARAAMSMESFSGRVVDDAGAPETQAGAHPATASAILRFATDTDGHPLEDAKDVRVSLPPGFLGNPTAIPRCPLNATVNLGDVRYRPVCPPESQIGLAQVYTPLIPGIPLNLATNFAPGFPIYNLEPPPGVPARFGFNAFVSNVYLDAVVRPGDFGIDVVSRNSSQALELDRVDVTLWGRPMDRSHDVERAGSTCMTDVDPQPILPCRSSATPRPFLTNPFHCAAGLLSTSLAIDSWQTPGVFAKASFDHDEDGNPMQVERCDAPDFDPRVVVAAGERRAGPPTGLDVELSLPQVDDWRGIGEAHLKRAVVTLPEGMAISAAAAGGLQTCSDEQLGLGSSEPARCPDASKIGSVAVDTPLIDETLPGSVYLRPQASSDPGSGDMFRLAIEIRSDSRGLVLKLPGSVRVDERSGRIEATFDDNPQVPFTSFRLHFDGGPQAALIAPSSCGTKTTTAVMSSWSGKQVTRSSTFVIDRECETASAFAPTFRAGVANPVAGGSSPLTVEFGRPDGQQELGAINASLPPGLLGVLKSVPLCPAARGAAGTCGPESRVGKVLVAAGAGAQPLWLPEAGRPEASVSLTEPYRAGDIAGMSIVVPAMAGPFDLGTVVTKAYLRLRPADQGIDMQSDPLPRIVKGVPVQVRTVRVVVDRPGFMTSPTSCRAMATHANVFSQSWVKASRSARFQVGGCERLALAPVIGVQGGGKGNTKRFQHPALKVTVRQSAGQAHLRQADVVLPKAFNVDLQAPALKAACPREVYAQDKCSPKAIVGTVRAVTPLLAEPLTGPAFLLQKKGELPDIVMRLRNSQMSLDLIGVLDFLGDSRIITRVKNIPDAALSSFELNITGGKGGSLLNRSDLCAKKAATQATFAGHNAKTSLKTPMTRISGCATANKAARGRSASTAGSRTAAVRAAVSHHRANGSRS